MFNVGPGGVVRPLFGKIDMDGSYAINSKNVTTRSMNNVFERGCSAEQTGNGSLWAKVNNVKDFSLFSQPDKRLGFAFFRRVHFKPLFDCDVSQLLHSYVIVAAKDFGLRKCA